MAIFGTEEDDNKILAALALALVNQPRASMQDIAKAVGISKATLYRFCETREQLVERLETHSIKTITALIQVANLEVAPPLEALREMTENGLKNKEITAFLLHYVEPERCYDIGTQSGWDAMMDAFFLRGQQEGAFRIDIPAAALTEIWSNLLVGMIDGERRGRVARAGLAEMMERVFLHGCAVN